MNSMETQRKEFDAADRFAQASRMHSHTPIVDDDYPQVRHVYEGALSDMIRAMLENGRFEKGNRYGLTLV